MYYFFLDYGPRSFSHCFRNGGITKVTCIDVLVSTVLSCLEQTAGRGGHRHRVLADIFINYMHKTVNKHIRLIWQVMLNCKPK